MADILFNRYEVVNILRATDRTISYKVVDTSGRTCYLKLVQAGPQETDADLSAVRRLMAVDSPRVAAPVAAEATSDGYYFVREWVAGTPLHAGMVGAEQPEEARALIADACIGVGAIHSARAVHGNLSPSNLIQRDDGAIVVVDGGMRPRVLFPAAAPPELGQYISPEQAQNIPARPQTDVYLLGVMLYELLAGSHPFEGVDAASVVDSHRVQPLPKPSLSRPEVPPSLDGIVARATAKAPDQRYSDANALRGALIEAPAEGRRSPWLWVLLVAAAAVVVLVAALLVTSGGDTAAVPDLAGLTLKEAETNLSDAGLRVGEISEEGTPEAEPGIVLSQDPEAGAEVEADSTVALTVSSLADIEVPDVVGASEAEATARLGQDGLRIGEIQRENSKDVEAGFIVSQKPVGGETVKAGSEVSLVVSSGPEAGSGVAVIPDVVGLGEEAAATALEDAGFRVRSRVVKSDEPAGVVISQDPAAGTEAKERSRVSLEVSEGPAEKTIAVPDISGLGVLDSRKTIKDAGLKIEYDWVFEGAPFLSAIRQAPAPETMLAEGGTVLVTISLPTLEDFPGMGGDTTTTTGGG